MLRAIDLVSIAKSSRIAMQVAATQRVGDSEPWSVYTM